MKRKWLWLGLVAIILAGCATFGVKPWADRSPSEKSSYFMSIYNRQYASTMALATRGNLTAAEKEIVRTRKDLLKKLHPAILAYDEIIVRGDIPTALDEQKILDILDRLTLLAVGG